MWRTWIKVGPRNQYTPKLYQDKIRYQLVKISRLLETGELSWYYFLLHEKPEDPDSVYFDVVFTTDLEDPKSFLPEGFVDTLKIPPDKKISEVDTTLLVNEDPAIGWQIVGEQSEFIVKLVCSHKESVVIPEQQITQFMNFFMNPLELGLKS